MATTDNADIVISAGEGAGESDVLDLLINNDTRAALSALRDSGLSVRVGDENRKREGETDTRIRQGGIVGDQLIPPSGKVYAAGPNRRKSRLHVIGPDGQSWCSKYEIGDGGEFVEEMRIEKYLDTDKHRCCDCRGYLKRRERKKGGAWIDSM